MPDFDAIPAGEAARAEVAADAKLSQVLELWRRLAIEGGLPRPRDMDAIALPTFVLPYVTVLDVIDGGRTFHVRLVGTASVAAAGRDFTGKRLDEAMSPQMLNVTAERYRAAIVHRRPILGYAEYAMPDGSTIRNLIMSLPLASDGTTVDRILGVFSPKSDWLARQALRTQDALAYRKPTRSFVVL